jgi:hypothetical protein
MNRTIVLLLLAAIVLGVTSPFVAVMVGTAPDAPDLAYAWFVLLPTMIDQWFLPEGYVLTVPLAMVVFTFQYLSLLAVTVVSLPLARFVYDFVSPPRHRTGSLGRRQ